MNIKTPTWPSTRSSARSRVEHPNLCVTGDPDQSIYGWRGANLSNILEFERDFPGCRVVTLERNYRSTKNIISVADHLIRFNRNRKPKSLTTENPMGDPVELTIYPRESDEAEGDRRQDRRPGARRRVRIRRHRRLLPRDGPHSSVRAGLPRRPGFPIRSSAASRSTNARRSRTSLAYLSLLVNPKDDLAFMRVVNVPPRGLGKTSLEHLIAAARERQVPLLEMARQATSSHGPAG